MEGTNRIDFLAKVFGPGHINGHQKLASEDPLAEPSALRQPLNARLVRPINPTH